MHNAIIHHDPEAWAAVPANNGGNGPSWQWGNEILIGFTRGTFLKSDKGHQCRYDSPFASWLARSRDGGESWTAWRPDGYAGNLNPTDMRPTPAGLDFTGDGFAVRVEGTGYHGNDVARWFASGNRGSSWDGPFEFTGLLDHPELSGQQFTARTAYVVDGSQELLLFMTVRQPLAQPDLRVTLTDKTFLTRTRNGGGSFEFVSWVVPWDDPQRAAMPAPVRLSESRLLAAVRRRSSEHNWIDCYRSEDNGASWSFLYKVGNTEDGNDFNGNPPSLLVMADGRLCAVHGNRTDRQIVASFSEDEGASWGEPAVLRDDFESANGWPDLGYARLFQRPDGRLVAAYFWCTAERPQTHIEATIFEAPAA